MSVFSHLTCVHQLAHVETQLAAMNVYAHVGTEETKQAPSVLVNITIAVAL